MVHDAKVGSLVVAPPTWEHNTPHFIKEDNALCPTSLRTKNILSVCPFILGEEYYPFKLSFLGGKRVEFYKLLQAHGIYTLLFNGLIIHKANKKSKRCSSGSGET